MGVLRSDVMLTEVDMLHMICSVHSILWSSTCVIQWESILELLSNDWKIVKNDIKPQALTHSFLEFYMNIWKTRIETEVWIFFQILCLLFNFVFYKEKKPPTFSLSFLTLSKITISVITGKKGSLSFFLLTFFLSTFDIKALVSLCSQFK